MIVSFETRMPSGVARSRSSICAALPPRKYESRSVVAARERRRVDAEGVLEVGADVGVGVVDGGDAGDAGHARDRRGEARAARSTPGGAVATTSAPSVSCASTRACWS